MKLKNIHIENIKCFEDYTVELLKPETQEPLNVCVMVGPNGCGKSTIMEALVSALTTADETYGGRILDEKAIKCGQDSCDIKLSFSLNDEEKALFGTEKNEFVIFNRKERTTDSDEEKFSDYLLYPEELWGEISGDGGKAISDELESERNQYVKYLSAFIKNKQTGCILYFDAFRYLPTTSPNGINMDIIPNTRSGSLMSNVNPDNMISNKYFNVKQWLLNLDYMRLKEEGGYYKQVYEHVLRALEMLFQPLSILEIDTSGNIIFQDGSTGEKIGIDMLSDGFKNLFLIVGAVIMRLSTMGGDENTPFYMNEAIVLIDEIDCHIHPRWQRNIIPGLKKLFPNCQYIVSTHSPYILESVQEYEIKQIGEKNIV